MILTTVTRTIADSVENVMGAQWYDGNISIPGCDKNMPGFLIAIENKWSRSQFSIL